MKRLKQHWGAKLLSFLLSGMMAIPVLALFLLSAPAARAQDANAHILPRWAILDFANPSGYGTTDVGRLASDSFVVELAKIRRYEVIPRQDVLNGIQNENLTPPLNLTSIEKLGQSLGVDGVVAGEIASVSFSRDHRQATVNLVVRVIDPRSGYLLNGALAQGVSNTRPIPVTDDEELVNEAFGNAAFRAVQQISKFNLPVATVLIGRDTTSVSLNKGSRDGLYTGLEMLVTRNGVVTGKIRVADLTTNDSNAVVTDQGGGITIGDRATALYHLPNYSIDAKTHEYGGVTASEVGRDNPSPGTHHSAFSGVAGVLVALLAGYLLYTAIRSGHKDSSLGGAVLSGYHALAGRATDIGGSLTALPVGITISNYIPVTVRIIGNTGNIPAQDFLEYHVYRSDQPTILDSPANLQGSASLLISTQSISGTATNNGNNGGNGGNNGGNNTAGTSTLGIFGLTFGQVPLLVQAGHASLQTFDDVNNKLSVTVSKPAPTDSSTLVTISALTFSTTGTTSGTGFFPPLPGTGLQFGQRVFYQVEGLYEQPATDTAGSLNPGTNGGLSTNSNSSGTNSNSGTGTGGTSTSGQNTTGQNTSGTSGIGGHVLTFQLTARRNTNYITYIEPVHPRGNSVTSTGPTNVNVTVPATAGANDYILQVTTDPNFSSSRTIAANPGNFTASPSDPTNSAGTISTANGTAVVFNNINLTALFPNGTQFFYRIGARDSRNGTGSDNPYIFSDPLALVASATGAVRYQSGLRHRHA